MHPAAFPPAEDRVPLPPPPENATERRAARRGLAIGLLALAFALAGALWAGRGQIESHRAWWFGGASARIAMHWPALSPAMDEAALQRHFAGTSLQCSGASAQRSCTADLAQADGVAAARLLLTLQAGRLRQAEVLLPWWAQHAAARVLSARLGAPTSIDAVAPAPGVPRALAWELPQGTVALPRDPGWNPWRWTAVRWVATGVAR